MKTKEEALERLKYLIGVAIELGITKDEIIGIYEDEMKKHQKKLTK